MEPLYLDYATGALSPAARLLVDTHLTMRPDRRADVAVWEAVGAQLLDTGPEPISEIARARVQRRLDRAEALAEEEEVARAGGVLGLPEPLASAIGRPLEALTWTSPIPGMHEWAFPQYPDARLLRLNPGGGVFEHSHTGLELTLILRGAYADGEGVWNPGDLEVADSELWHAPRVIGTQECLCFAVTEGAYRLKGWKRLLAGFTGFRDRLA
jgi:putative transcriptional regulator